MLERLAVALSTLGIESRPVSFPDDAGKVTPAVQFDVVRHTFLAIQRPGQILLVLAYRIPEADVSAIAALDEQARDRLYLAVSRVLLHGRTGHAFKFRQPEDRRYPAGINLQQSLVVNQIDQSLLQRILDGLQEMVIAAASCRLVLGQEVSDARHWSSGPPTGSSAQSGMYA